MTLPTLQFPLDGIADQVCPLLAIVQSGIYAVHGPSRQTGRNLLEIDLFSAHGGDNIVDITY